MILKKCQGVSTLLKINRRESKKLKSVRDNHAYKHKVRNIHTLKHNTENKTQKNFV